ncbi:metallophosphoesterase family protein [Roseinatronobacter sp. NSM]|uniref:metallophosphoesterase family protein n=1 Tax=Roseinatronobacter sp. NSM TaxID=3457785 RepID=UPI00403535D7
MAFRFIHTADLHLDSPLRSLALRDPDLASLVGGATRMALRNIIDLCLSERVDALLISGDLYDGSQTSMKTARFLASELARLNEAGIRAFLIRGNHDAESRITRELTLPPCVHLFDGRAGLELLEHGPQRIAVHGLSFREPKAPESLLPKYRPPVGDAVNIGLMHTSLNGAAGHDPYAPCALSDLQASGFDYWALGHIHKRAVYPGAACVVMPGIPQGRDIGEVDGGSVTLVTVDDGGALNLEERSVALAAFCIVPVDVTGMNDWNDLLASMRTALERADRRAPHLVARLRLTGATPLAQRLLRDQDLALAEAQELARGMGQTWVEKLVLDLGNTPSVTGELAQLAALINDDFRHSDSFTATLEEMRATLQAALPPDPALRAQFDQLDPAIIDDGLAQVLARLGGTR